MFRKPAEATFAATAYINLTLIRVYLTSCGVLTARKQGFKTIMDYVDLWRQLLTALDNGEKFSYIFRK